jgi:hypothetical protein
MNHGWFTKNLGDAMLAGEALARLEERFVATYGKSASSGTRAVFMRHESEGRLQCEVIVYFSPDTATLAAALDADPCAKPSQGDLGLLVGSENSWQALFPEHPGGQ